MTIFKHNDRLISTNNIMVIYLTQLFKFRQISKEMPTVYLGCKINHELFQVTLLHKDV